MISQKNKKIDQRQVLKFYIGGYRKVYNITVEYINNLPKETTYEQDSKGNLLKDDLSGNYIYVGNGLGNYKKKVSTIPSFYIDKNGKQQRKNQTSLQSLRPVINKIIDEKHKWIREKKFPCHLVDRAIQECSTNYSSLCEKVRLTGKRCFLGYKSKRKTVVETINLECGMFGSKKNTIFSTTVGTVKSSEDFYKPENESKLQYNRHTKEWFIILALKNETEHVDHRYDIVGIDPGEKVFSTLYCPDKGGHVVSICENIRDTRLFKQLYTIDNLVSKRKKSKRDKRKGFSRAIHRIHKKIKNMKSDMHHKASLFICKNYKHIVLPKYESKQMMSNLNSLVCRSMSTLSFYQFKEKLKYKSELYGCKIFDVTEEYTTVTCGKCGSYNKPTDRSYYCKSCKTDIHRDFNGARNVLLKHL